MPYLNPPTKDHYRDVLKDIGTDEEAIKRDVKYLIEWLEQTEYLPSVKDEEFLTSVLIKCKNSLQTAKDFLDYYYSRRTLGSDMFACRDPCDSELKRALQMFMILPLPNLTPDGYRIIVSRNKRTGNLPKSSYILSSLQIQNEILIKSDICKGHILIYDSSAFTFSDSAVLMAEVKKLADIFKKTTKSRFKESYLLNLTPTFNTFFNTVKQFLSGKLVGRIDTWKKKPEDLVEVYPKNVLPSDFGGDERPIEELKKAWYDYVMEHRDWFMAEQSMKADLSKRPKNDALSAELASFGLSGTFRKINLD